MKRTMERFLLVVLAAACALAPARAQDWETPPPAEADLAQCYTWAREQSESLRMQEEQIRQLEQQFRIALSGALPALSFNASDKWLDSASGSNATSAAPSQPQVNFAVSQLLFSGLREYAAMAAAKHQGQAAELQLRRARGLLYQNVSAAFYLVVALETGLANSRSAIALIMNRIAELRRFEALGRSRHSEVVLVESQQAALEAQAESQRGQIEAARELLSFLTGKELARAKLLDRLERLRTLDPEEAMLGRAYDRSDVLALRKLVDAQEDQVRIAKGAWAPSVSFLGNYYLKRQRALDPIKWDAGVAASLPLFAGGGQLAAVRQADSQVSQARYAFELGLRQARSEIHTAYVTLRAALANAAANEKAYRKADESYRLETKEYRAGLVTNLDVLAALNALVSAKTTFDASVVQMKLALLQLKVATEELP
ncbi:MAG: TolC family protein [Elusimicrobia bacterium]|nr:TolC family protein [Elusimicrobiota bacterium]